MLFCSSFPTFLRNMNFVPLSVRAAAVALVMLVVDVGPVWAQKRRQEEAPAAPSYTLGYSLVLLAAGAALFVVGRPHARVRDGATNEHDQG